MFTMFYLKEMLKKDIDSIESQSIICTPFLTIAILKKARNKYHQASPTSTTYQVMIQLLL